MRQKTKETEVTWTGYNRGRERTTKQGRDTNKRVNLVPRETVKRKGEKKTSKKKRRGKNMINFPLMLTRELLMEERNYYGFFYYPRRCGGGERERGRVR